MYVNTKFSERERALKNIFMLPAQRQQAQQENVEEEENRGGFFPFLSQKQQLYIQYSTIRWPSNEQESAEKPIFSI